MQRWCFKQSLPDYRLVRKNIIIDKYHKLTSLALSTEKYPISFDYENKIRIPHKLFKCNVEYAGCRDSIAMRNLNGDLLCNNYHTALKSQEQNNILLHQSGWMVLPI